MKGAKKSAGSATAPLNINENNAAGSQPPGTHANSQGGIRTSFYNVEAMSVSGNSINLTNTALTGGGLGFATNTGCTPNSTQEAVGGPLKQAKIEAHLMITSKNKNKNKAPAGRNIKNIIKMATSRDASMFD